VTEAGVITGVSVSHSRATVDEIEAACATDERTRVRDLLSMDGVEEAFVIQTCNRAEAYVVTDAAADGRHALEDVVADVRGGAVTHLGHEDALRHLMRVAAGLESLVVGEDQILGQVKTALAEARAVGGVGQVLDEALMKAVHVGERARNETKINEGVLSLGSAAVDVADRELDLDGARALVVGAGEMGQLAARALARVPLGELVVANRTVSHAEHLASEVDIRARAVGLDAIADEVGRADVVVSATSSPDYLLDDDMLATAGETLVVDVAQPRDVAPDAGALPGVDLHDIDTLQSVTDETRQRRKAAAEAVEAMIDDEFERLLESFKRRRADDAIGAMYEAADRMKSRELDRAVSKLDAQGELTDEQRETVEALADSLVGQLLAAPTKSLREAAAEDDWTTIQTAMRLFDPDFGGDAPRPPETESPRSGRPDELPDDAEVPDHVGE
jgi:glutamyl-tRNA reductase